MTSALQCCNVPEVLAESLPPNIRARMVNNVPVPFSHIQRQVKLGVCSKQRLLAGSLTPDGLHLADSPIDSMVRSHLAVQAAR